MFPPDIATATRPVDWHIHDVWIMYILLIPTLLVLGMGLYRHAQLWKLGQPTRRLPTTRRLLLVLRYAVGQARLFRETIAGTAHAAIVWAFLSLFAGSLVVFIHHDLGIHIMQGWFYLIYQSLFLDLAGVLLVLGLTVMLVRRYVIRVPRLRPGPMNLNADPADWVMPAGLLFICLQGFLLEALRIAGTGDPWSPWSPVGWALAHLLSPLDPVTIIRIDQFLWWFHLVTVFAWVAFLPFTGLVHLFTAPLNIYFANTEGPAADLKPVDFERAESFGASRLTDLSRKDLLDLDACTSCGRCQAVCPAYAVGKPLSPQELILDLRRVMRANASHLQMGGDSAKLPLLVGSAGVIKEETVWACTTCRACMEECPVLIEHVPKIIDLRRYLVMDQSTAPETLLATLRNLEARSHPYRGVSNSRIDWAVGLAVPLLCNVKATDVLYWVGCAAAFDPRSQKIARSLVQIFREAGIRFAVLGLEEQCTGDPARRMGNEYVYEILARQNIEILQRYQFERIVTSCPHCLNQLGGEYRSFGARFRVLHHSQLIRDLVESGRLQLDPATRQQITFHDPCYLGRYQGEYDAPRAAISATGADILEMGRSRSRSFCCGAGGAHAWMEDRSSGERINLMRAREALATGATTVATACPFCLQMMEDGVKTLDGGQTAVKDVAEIIAQALLSTRDTPGSLRQGK